MIIPFTGGIYLDSLIASMGALHKYTHIEHICVIFTFWGSKDE